MGRIPNTYLSQSIQFSPYTSESAPNINIKGNDHLEKLRVPDRRAFLSQSERNGFGSKELDPLKRFAFRD